MIEADNLDPVFKITGIEFHLPNRKRASYSFMKTLSDVELQVINIKSIEVNIS